MNKLFIPVIILAVLGAIVYIAMDWNYDNQNEALRNRADAQQEIIFNTYDNMWKVFKEMAQVPEAAKQAFKDLYPDLIAGRYDNARGGAMFSMIQESNPEFDWSLYGDLNRAIQAERAKYLTAANLIESIKQEHDNLIEKKPSKWFIDDKTPIEIQRVRSERTNDAFESGVDEPVDLFN